MPENIRTLALRTAIRPFIRSVGQSCGPDIFHYIDQSIG